MRVVMHCVYFPPEVGGLESHVFHLSRNLAARGHRVDMVTSRSRPDSRPHEVLDGVGVWRTWFPSRSPLGWAAWAMASAPRLGALARGADVIHAQAFASVLPGVSARRVTGTPLVATFHTSHFLKRAESPFWAPILGRLVAWPDRALAASREIARVAEGLAPGTRVEALVNGVETSLFRPVPPALPPAPGPRLVIPRRLFAKNGVEHFIRALPAIAESFPDVEAIVVGDGPERHRLEELAGALGVAHRLTFVGNRPHVDMPAFLCSGDAAVFPSLMEATSVAALECMACGVPVAASRVGGLPEIVDSDVGVLFRPEDPDDLARAVVGLLSREDLEGVGRRARSRVVERWSNDRLVGRHLEIYEELTAKKAGGSHGEE